MEEHAKQPRVKLTKGAWWWLAVLVLTMLSVWPLGHFDDATELTPDHTDVLEYCFWFAGAVAIISAGVCFFRSSGKLVSRLLISVFCFALLGGLSTLLVTSTVANIVENRRDFPPGETRSYWTLLPIQRALPYGLQNRFKLDHPACADLVQHRHCPFGLQSDA